MKMLENPDIKIVIATHKKYRMPQDDIYFPLQVGAEGKESIGYQRDNSGDNISATNPYFCELTGMYWEWKNLNADYLGLAHYRRHFCLQNKKGSNKEERKWLSILNKEEAISLCKKYDVIVPQKRKYYIETLYTHYAHTHYAEHLDETRKIIAKLYPNYLDTYDKVVNQTYGYMFNMMIMRKDYFNSYCEWLFSILFELEKRISMPELSAFQDRFYGRVSEIIFNVWLEYQIEHQIISKEKVKEIGCIHMEQINWWNKGMAFVKAMFFGKKYEGSF